MHNTATVVVHGKAVQIMPETMQRTREWFAENHRTCAAEQLKPASERRWSVASHVNIAEYVAKCEQRAQESLAGAGDHTVAFLQRALYIQTGECPSLL